VSYLLKLSGCQMNFILRYRRFVTIILLMANICGHLRMIQSLIKNGEGIGDMI